ncbi:hypothetical protein [Streptomyces aurantiogriseus]|uniref:Secreted protein n=1 Tax=Streptomyces aurantiogriseus TaxID=66870 RepID=A0A918BVF0_9ACTN|nr:hypothetical protein [Streptomyces aurantiogriseus]GGQ92683.1 hypothetical protein GCM10010251_04190 [Streptomyces aurantiogriseus]
MNIQGIAKKAVTAAAITVSAVALSTAPAWAGTNGHAYTDFEDCGVLSCTTIEAGEGFFTANGDQWKACDLLSDGDRVIVEARWVSGGATHIYSATAASGTGTCGTYTKDIPEGVTVNLKVWHQNGASGTPKDVTSFKGVA